MTSPDTPPEAGWLHRQAHAAWMAWTAYRRSFVFGEELQGWPVVRHIAPGVWTLRAIHTGPRRVQDRGGWKPPVLTGVAVGVLYWFAYGGGALKGEALLQNSFFAGVFVALISIPLWRLARKTFFVIRLDQGVISWRGPDRKKHRVRMDELHSLEVIPHRWAGEEFRKHGDWRAARPGQASPKPLFQTSSELILHTGPEGSHWRTVAEFCNDESREQANRLGRALQLVAKTAERERQEGKRQAQAAGPL